MLATRVALATDIPACQDIVRALPDYFTPDVPDTVEHDLGRDTTTGWVIEEDGQRDRSALIGFAVIDRRSDRAAEILWAAVAPTQRNQGVGTRLIDHVLGVLETEGVAVVQVKTLDRSASYPPYVSTLAFWEGRGFVHIDTIDPLPGWQPGNPSAFYVAALRTTRG